MNDEEEIEESLKDVQKERDFLAYENIFLRNMLVTAAQLGEVVDVGRFIRQLVADSIESGLESGIVKQDGPMEMPEGLSTKEQEDFAEIWGVAIPWSITREIADEMGVDADKVRDFGPDREEEEFGPLPEEFGQMLRAAAEEVLSTRHLDWEERVKGKPVLHCSHDDHTCEHKFETLEEAVDVAAVELAIGRLQSVSHVTVDGVTVMEHEELVHRIEVIHNAGNN